MFSAYLFKIIDSLYKKLYNIVVKDVDSIKAFQKRELVKKDYNLIANMYSEEFGKKYEDIEVIEEFISKLKPNSRILDLGGGVGNLTDLLLKRGFDAICYDFSKEMMRNAKKLYPDVPYILDDIINMKKYFKDNTFDGIIAFYSLFHIPKEEIDEVFSYITDLLKENGILCFVVQLGNGEKFIDEPYLKEEGRKILYFNYFTNKQIDELLKINNFEKFYELIKEEIGENKLGKDGNKKIFIVARKR